MREIAPMSKSQRLADIIAATVGGWWFIIVQSLVIFTWMLLNSIGVFDFDKYPFTALNLLLSFEAAYTAPFIMMSQNRQAMIDRMHQQDDLSVDEQSLEHLQSMTDVIAALQISVDQLHAKISDTSGEKAPD